MGKRRQVQNQRLPFQKHTSMCCLVRQHSLLQYEMNVSEHRYMHACRPYVATEISCTQSVRDYIYECTASLFVFISCLLFNRHAMRSYSIASVRTCCTHAYTHASARAHQSKCTNRTYAKRFDEVNSIVTHTVCSWLYYANKIAYSTVVVFPCVPSLPLLCCLPATLFSLASSQHTCPTRFFFFSSKTSRDRLVFLFSYCVII